MTFVHADVSRWSIQVRREFRLDIDDLMFLRGGPLYAMNGPEGTEKRAKFMRLMGFEYFRTIPARDCDRDIYIRSK